MSKIDLTTKFFHGVGWDSTQASRIRILDDILKDGKILNSRDIAIKNGYDPTSKFDKIFLSVHPYGVYASEFKGDDYKKGYTGYDMTTDSFYFILSRKLVSDFDVESGVYPLECIVDGPIDLKKYLIGVGNVGYNISSNLIMCYYYTMYLKGDISQDEMLNRVRNCFNPGINYLQFRDNKVIFDIISSWASICMDFAGDTQYNRVVESVYEKSSEEFVDPKNYNVIKRVFEENEFPVKFYDFEGYSVEPEKQLSKVKHMQQYIKKNATYKKLER